MVNAVSSEGIEGPKKFEIQLSKLDFLQSRSSALPRDEIRSFSLIYVFLEVVVDDSTFMFNCTRFMLPRHWIQQL